MMQLGEVGAGAEPGTPPVGVVDVVNAADAVGDGRSWSCCGVFVSALSVVCPVVWSTAAGFPVRGCFTLFTITLLIVFFSVFGFFHGI